MRPFGATGVDAIVVLSSGVSPPTYERPYSLPDPQTFERCRYAAWIYGKLRIPVLASGGQGAANQTAFAVTMGELLESANVPRAQIWLEERSRNTHENAEFSAAILRTRGVRRIALVVNARSMLRAAACFRKQGIDVVPAPVRFDDLSATVEDWMLNWKAVRGNEETLHEALGLLWYRLRGWI